MSTIRVTTQAELDTALRDHGSDASCVILIESPSSVWLALTDTGSATVQASGRASVEASGSATVQASGRATVRATPYVAIHLHSARANVVGGVLIDVDALDLTDPQAWCDYTGANVIAGTVLLYKAVDDELMAGHAYTPTKYPIGETVTAPDWRDTNDCGHGLHASPHPHQSQAYATECERMLVVSVPLADLRPIPGDPAKAKARAFTVLREVHIDGSEIT